MSKNAMRDVPKKTWKEPVVKTVSDVRRTKGGVFVGMPEQPDYRPS